MKTRTGISIIFPKSLIATVYLLVVLMFPKMVPAADTWEVVGTAGFSAGQADYTSLAFNGSTPYVAYQDAGNSGKATVMKFNGAAWEVVGIAGFSAGLAYYTSLAFDGSTPYVAYRDEANSDKATVMKLSTSPEPIPTLNEWGLIILSVVLAGITYITIRRRQGVPV